MPASFDISTLAPTNLTAAQFRAWASFIHNAITVAGGWVNTADTGQIDLTTVAAPGAASTSMGYKIYRMDDALQATAPVFMKMEFGSSTGAATQPGIWFTLGTGTDGAGNITGIFRTRVQHGPINSAAGITKNYASVGPARFVFGMFLDGGVNIPFWFSVERTVDSNGADTNVGIILCYGRISNNCSHQYIPFSGTIPPVQTGLHIVLAQENPSTFSGNVGISAVIPMAGNAKQPGMNLMVVKAGDFLDWAAPLVPIYGSNHQYFHLGPSITTLRNSGAGQTDANTRLLIRYE